MNKEIPERKREKLRQEELRKNPTGNLNDAFNRASSGNLTDLANSLSWKAIGIIALVIAVGLAIASIFFK